MRVASTMPLFAPYLHSNRRILLGRQFTFLPRKKGKLGQKSGCLGAISIILIQYEAYENLDMQYSVQGYSGYAIAH